MLAQSKDPHCPQCKGKPTDGQSVLTAAEQHKLTGRTAKRAHSAKGLICRCARCGAIYSFRDGFSTLLT